MSGRGAELDDVIASLERGDWEVWQKVEALNGSEFLVCCCCNSEKCQRIKVVQTSGHSAVLMESIHGNPPAEMPVEIAKILDACKTNPALKKQVAAYNRSRFDLIFKCKGRALIDCTIGDS